MLTGVILDRAHNIKLDNQPIGLMEVGEEKLIHKQIHEMRKLCDEIILVTEDPRRYLAIVGNSIRIITDYYEGLTPLSSLHAALSLAKFPNLWVVSTNKPFISAPAALSMLEYRMQHKLDIVLPSIGKEEFFHSIYHQSCLPITEQLLGQGHTDIKELFPLASYKFLDADFFTDQGLATHFSDNIHSEEDIQLLLSPHTPA